MIIYDPEQTAASLSSAFRFRSRIAGRVFVTALKAHPLPGPRLASGYRKNMSMLDRMDLDRVHDPAMSIVCCWGESEDGKLLRPTNRSTLRGSITVTHPAQRHPTADRFVRPHSGAGLRYLAVSATWLWRRASVSISAAACITPRSRLATDSVLLNDIVIAIRKLQAENRIKTAWVIDIDAHKGDGTAALTADDPSIVTLSIHMGRGWPLDGPSHDAAGRINPSFIPSDIDIPVFAGENRFTSPSSMTVSGIGHPAHARAGGDCLRGRSLRKRRAALDRRIEVKLEQLLARDWPYTNF